MTEEFAGRSVVVTGASSGMGRAEALALGRAGAKVWVTDVAATAGEALIEEIRATGAPARFVPVDVTDPQAWARLAACIEEEDGRLDGLVNNAGVSHRFGIVDTTVEDWRRVVDVNLSGVFYGMKLLAPLLQRTGSASVVNVSSTAGMAGYFAAAYSASKWGVRGLSKVGALEFAEAGVRVNSIHPGLVDTPLLRSGSEAFVDESLRSVPAGRVAQPGEIAEAVLFLLSDRARYITGTEIVIDGGLTSGGLYHRILDGLRAHDEG
ncbi:SDR family NAD(P)-dependent oxidoreductase [Pseudonocardia sp. MH-G8]|uniref:SDR family NAD(P)-dependent oxidoreductase n=1 Tax=Pseudonocardia sp. MH-G8 TaxID=1854588 RepID=UPI000B9FF987|nr:SDR family NAD(P)-dependent oxidoreductase [Pseudonocardia sp. MH-G8]OZM76851.1 oxidoreductase [Pseudonocardia sp. MH-G8]